MKAKREQATAKERRDFAYYSYQSESIDIKVADKSCHHCSQQIGKFVEGPAGNQVVLDSAPGDGVIPVCIASGLLVKPISGDTVLVTRVGRRNWVTMVLARASHETHVTIGSFEEEYLFRGKRIKFSSRAIDLIAKHLRTDCTTFEIKALLFCGTIDKIRSIFGEVRLFALNYFAKFDRRATYIEESDVLRAHEFVVKAVDLARFEGEYVSIEAKQHLTMDGKRIVVP